MKMLNSTPILTVHFFQRLWALCDLALGILIAKGLPLELGKYPPNVKISDMYFTPSDDTEFVNNQIYIPAEMIQQQQKKPNKNVLPVTAKKVSLKKCFLTFKKMLSVNLVLPMIQAIPVTTSDEDSDDDDLQEEDIGMGQDNNDLQDQKNGSG